MTIDPQAQADLESTAGLPPVHELSPEEARASSERAAPILAGPPAAVERVEEVELGGVRGRLYAPAGSNLPVVAWFHGGGWVVGSLDTHDSLCRRLAADSGAAVVAVDYRLAPEHRYPAAVDDAWTATTWLARSADRLGLDPARLAVGGDSAGGNLAAVVALRARDEGLHLALQLLVYPVTDHDLDSGSYVSNATGFGLTRQAMAWYWDHYCPALERRAEPWASPLRAPSLAGVAPAFVATCELDPLFDEGEAYARRLEADGVRVTLSRYEGMIHGFARMFAVIDRSHDLMADMAAAVQGALLTKGVAGSAPGG